MLTKTFILDACIYIYIYIYIYMFFFHPGKVNLGAKKKFKKNYLITFKNINTIVEIVCIHLITTFLIDLF